MARYFFVPSARPPAISRRRSAVDLTPIFSSSAASWCAYTVSYSSVQNTPLAYNGAHTIGSSCPCTAAYPSSAPQLNVRPRNAWGQFVTRFMAGYAATNARDDAPSATLKSLSLSRIPRPASSWAPKNTVAAVGDTAPDAIGLFLVRATSASMSRSQRSFTVQPAPRSRNAPAQNSDDRYGSGGHPGGAASAMDQRHGHASRYTPAGRSNRTSLA